MTRRKWKCLECQIDTGKIGEHYMLWSTIWEKIHNSPIGMLCIGCAEKRLGRQLNMGDFNKSHINRVKPGETKSVRLMNRLTSNE